MKKLSLIILLLITCSMYAKDTWVYQPLLEEKLVRIPKSAQYDTYTKAEIDGKDTAVLDSSEAYTNTKLENYLIKDAVAGTNTTVDIKDGVLKVNVTVTPPTDLTAYTKTADFPKVPCIAKNISDIKQKANIGDSYLKTLADSRFQLKGDYIAEAPVDGKQYARRDADWSEVATTDGYWYFDKLTEDVTCDTDVKVKGKLYIDGAISFDGDFWMDTEKVSHTNTIPSFNVDTKTVEFVPMAKATPVIKTFQQYALDRFRISHATLGKTSEGKPTITLGTGNTYSFLTLDLMMPEDITKIILYFTYTFKGFGSSAAGAKIDPYFTITGTAQTSYDKDGINIPFYSSRQRWAMDVWQRGNKRIEYDVSDIEFDPHEATPMSLNLTVTGCGKDDVNEWVLWGCAVGYELEVHKK